MKHTHTKTIATPQTVVTCDRCGREMLPDNHNCEHQERLAVHFRAGYESVFGDGSLVEADLCQHCVKEVLGKWLRVSLDDPFEPVQRSIGRCNPRGVYQQYQLSDTIEADVLRDAMRKLLLKQTSRNADD